MLSATKDEQKAAAEREKYLGFIENADLLIADGQYTDDEYQGR